jgi:hypothetical protein
MLVIHQRSRHFSIIVAIAWDIGLNLKRIHQKSEEEREKKDSKSIFLLR